MQPVVSESESETESFKKLKNMFGGVEPPPPKVPEDFWDTSSGASCFNDSFSDDDSDRDEISAKKDEVSTEKDDFSDKISARKLFKTVLHHKERTYLRTDFARPSTPPITDSDGSQYSDVAKLRSKLQKNSIQLIH